MRFNLSDPNAPTLYSCERFTGQGAAHWTGLWIPEDGEFVRLSDLCDSISEGRAEGFNRYSLRLSPESENRHTCIRYRSNKGIEKVLVARANMLAACLPPLPDRAEYCAADYLIAAVIEHITNPLLFESLESAQATIRKFQPLETAMRGESN